MAFFLTFVALVLYFWSFSTLFMAFVGIRIIFRNVARRQGILDSPGLTSGLSLSTGLVFLTLGGLMGLTLLGFAWHMLSLAFQAGY